VSDVDARRIGSIVFHFGDLSIYFKGHRGFYHTDGEVYITVTAERGSFKFQEQHVLDIEGIKELQSCLRDALKEVKRDREEADKRDAARRQRPT